MPEINVAWWNLENLFDSEDATRDPALARRLNSELRGWTTAIRDRKLDQLASVVQLMFGGEGPDVLGVCELENERVLKLLASRLSLRDRNYQVVGHSSPDARGIDISFLVDTNRLDVEFEDHQVVYKRSATRDIFWVELRDRETGSAFVAIGNHWPARSGGRYTTAPYRMLTGETVSFLVEDIFDQFDVGNNLPIIVMGDFNDEPFDRSMQEYLLGTRDADQVRRARSPRLLNLMWPLMSDADPGTYRYGSAWNMLDQFLVTKGMLRGSSPIRVNGGPEIFRPDFMQGSGGRPQPFGRPSKRNLDQDGYSDHFPIQIVLQSD